MPDSNYFRHYFDHLHNRLQTANVADLEQVAQLASQALSYQELLKEFKIEKI